MPSDPERYLTADDLEREIPFDRHDLGLDAPEWATLLAGDGDAGGVLGRESDRIDGWAGTTFATETATDSFGRPRHVPNRDLPLPARPVQSVASVDAGGAALAEGDDYALEETHLVLLDAAPIDAWPTAYASIDVEWTYGHDDVPGPVRDALIRLCRNAIERVQTDGLASESTGDGASYTYRLPTDVLAEAQGSVMAYEAPSYYGGAQVL